jgi:hypothetical protein
VTEHFEETFIKYESTGCANALFNALGAHSQHLESATNMFIDLGTELYEGLKIIDPALAECCHLLYVGKGGFLMLLSNYVEFEFGENNSRFIRVSKLKGLMNSVDLELLYEDYIKGFKSQARFESGVKFYWPSSALDDFMDDLEDLRISFEDDESAIELCQMIIEQNKRLKEAKERLRILIKENFSIEEILSQSSLKPDYK